MKARLLKKLLNNTDYIISNSKDCIAVGSPLCSKLISIDKETLKIKCAMDPLNEGRESLGNEELVFIFDKLQELIKSGEIKEIIDGKDIIDNPLPVYTYSNGKIIESVTDKYGWPNTDDDGNLMYVNAYFKTKKEAIEKGLSECNSAISLISRNIKGYEDLLKDSLEERKKFEEYVENYKKMLEDEKN